MEIYRICIFVDGDDYLNDNAFNIINNTYNNTKCWMTLGNCVGKFCNNYFIVEKNKNTF